MSDLIDRQAAIDAVSKLLKGIFVEYKDIAEKTIGKIPSAQPERKKGHWILQDDISKKLYGWNICSECGAWIGEPANYCSYCGADMRGENK